jgi:4-hydroxy-tetrahydrodipicolinate synthase
MATASDARAWAHSALKGIGDSLYTPFCGVDGDDIDWDAYRRLVRYCVGDLGHPMLWVTSGVAEFWSLTITERKRLLEIAIEEARAINPDVVVQSCTAALSAKDCLVLTRHAQEAGADIVYIQTPMMELHAGDCVLKFFRYISDRTEHRAGDVQFAVLGIRAECRGERAHRRRSRPCARRRRAHSGHRTVAYCTTWHRSW